MASFANNTPTNFLKLLFQAVGWASIADNTASGPATNLYVSLHTADPGVAGSQTTSETSYTNYARVAVARTSGGWTVSGTNPEVVTNAAAITFPQCGVTGATCTYWGVGLSSTGAGTLLASGPIGPGSNTYGFSCTSASPGVLTVPGSSLSVNNQVMVYAAGPAFLLPAGLTEGTVYYVGTATGTAITLSTTASNANPVNTTGAGTGALIVCQPLVVAQNVTPAFAVSQLTLSMV